MQAGYFNTAWRDIKDSPGWFGRLCTLALIGLIPVFGQIVICGYLYGWAREIAWGVHAPLPAHIFGNEDGRLYSRGFFALVIGLVCTLIPNVLEGALSGAAGVGVLAVGFSGGSLVPLALGAAMLNGLISLLCLALAVLLTFFQWVGTMRMSLYGRLSAGFQIKKIWAMMRHDGNGLWRILGMYVLLELAALAATGLCLVLVVIVAVAALLAVNGLGLNDYESLAEKGVGISSLRLIVLALLLLIMGGLVAMFANTFVLAMVARAMGYWTQGFDVPSWRGQDDPLPFQMAGFVGSGPTR